MSRPVSDVIRMKVNELTAEKRGFVIVLPAKHPGPKGFARIYSGHDRPPSWKGGTRTFAAQVDEPSRWHIFDTFQEAFEMVPLAVKGWCAGEIDGVEIAEVVIRPPVELLDVRSASILDALSKL